ncbi:MAG: hypothetical protein JJE52_10970 [Acidimicrobiia bacterium]|nr:hypothetical protein [Acidimicrobiia bacterium]
MRWDELSREEAEEHLAELVAWLPEAVERLAVDVGSAVVLDGSRESLEPLCRWVIGQPNTGGVLAPDAPAPPWYRYQAGFCAHYGVQTSLVRVIDGVAAYYAACLQLVQPARRWQVGGRDARDVGYAFYNAPVMTLGEHDAIPHFQIPTLVKRLVLPERPDDRDPPRLQRLYDNATGRSRPGYPEPVGFEVLEIGPRSFHVQMPETLEEDLGDAFDTLDERVAAIPGVERVVWEDREVLLVDGPIDRATLARRLPAAILG